MCVEEKMYLVSVESAIMPHAITVSLNSTFSLIFWSLSLRTINLQKFYYLIKFMQRHISEE